jgi:PAS domain S-box-containing protein
MESSVQATPPVRVLLLEDSKYDAELISAWLKGAGLVFELTRVDNRDTFAAALDEFRPDIILSDFALPTFDGKTALAMAQEHCPATPMLIVSGAIGDEMAVELLKSGARDYVLKDRLTRLPAAVRRALAEAREIRTRQSAERALRDSEAMFRTMSAAAGDAIILIDDHGLVTFWNAAAERIFGHTPQAMQGQDLLGRVLAPEAAGETRRLIDQLRRGDDGLPAGHTLELLARRSDGGELPLEMSISPIVLGDVQHALLIGRDISERKRTEKQLAEYRDHLEQLVDQRTADLVKLNHSLRDANRQLATAHTRLLEAGRLAAVGQLAAGVAHEINNPLAFVSSNLGTLKLYLDRLLDDGRRRAAGQADPTPDIGDIEADADALVAECRDGLARVSSIVHDLREFASVGSSEWQRADLRAGFDATLSLLRSRIGEATVVREFAPIPEVECLPSEINLVFMNLLLNAADAVRGAGTISLRTGTADGGAWFEVADTGSGISSENLPRVFDPFFTTKSDEKRMGLGLSIAYGIVQRHHGRIDVHSVPGQPTCFRVWLPDRQPPPPLPGESS